MNIPSPLLYSVNVTNNTQPHDLHTPEQIHAYEFLAWAISGCFTVFACLFSFILIYNHLRNWSNPEQQKYIVRLLLMVPIYAIDSWLSLRWKDYGIYFDIGRDCYEAYVIYQFFGLLTSYVEGDKPGTLFKILEEKPSVKYPFPLCCLPPFKPSPLFFIITKQFILQYVVIKPVMSIVAAVLQATGHYEEGNFRPWFGYVYVTATTFASVFVSMYFLVWFYFTTEQDLEKYSPVTKFICIKAILFFSFWQGVLIAILAFFDVIPEQMGDWTQENISRGFQDFIICIEMFILSIAHGFVFGYKPYKNDHENWYHSPKDAAQAITQPVKHFAKDVMNPSDVMKDMKNAYNPKHIKHARKEHKRVKKDYKLKGMANNTPESTAASEESEDENPLESTHVVAENVEEESNEFVVVSS